MDQDSLFELLKVNFICELTLILRQLLIVGIHLKRLQIISLFVKVNSLFFNFATILIRVLHFISLKSISTFSFLHCLSSACLHYDFLSVPLSLVSKTTIQPLFATH